MDLIWMHTWNHARASLCIKHW